MTEKRITPEPWPRTFGVFSERWQAYRALREQDDPRFELIEEEGKWKLPLHQA